MSPRDPPSEVDVQERLAGGRWNAPRPPARSYFFSLSAEGIRCLFVRQRTAFVVRGWGARAGCCELSFATCLRALAVLRCRSKQPVNAGPAAKSSVCGAALAGTQQLPDAQSAETLRCCVWEYCVYEEVPRVMEAAGQARGMIQKGRVRGASQTHRVRSRKLGMATGHRRLTWR